MSNLYYPESRPFDIRDEIDNLLCSVVGRMRPSGRR